MTTSPMRTCLAYVEVLSPADRENLVRLGRCLASSGYRLCVVASGPHVPEELTSEPSLLWLPYNMLKTLKETAKKYGLQGESPLPTIDSMFDSPYGEEVFHVEEIIRRLRGIPLSVGQIREEARWWMYIWRLVLGVINPSALIVWNGFLLSRASLVMLARHDRRALFFMERGPLPHTCQLDSEGVNGRSTTAQESWEGLATLNEDAHAQLAAYRKHLALSGSSAWEQPDSERPDALRRRLGIPSDARILFYPRQVEADTNLLLNSPLVRGNQDVLNLLRPLIKERPGWWLVIKPHPKGLVALDATHDVAERRVVVPDAHVHALVTMADLVVTINSSVAVEALLADKPVIQLGKGLLSNKGVVFESETREAAGQQIADLMDREQIQCVAQDRVDAVLHRMIFETLYRFDDEATEESVARLAVRVRETGNATPFDVNMDISLNVINALVLSKRNLDRLKALPDFCGRELLGALIERVKRRLTGKRE